MKKSTKANIMLAQAALKHHFGRQPLEALITASRTYPIMARVDIQVALEKIFKNRFQAKMMGLHAQYNHETITIAHLLNIQNYPVIISPLQHEEIDVGETLPVRCLNLAAWLSRDGATPFVVLLSQSTQYGRNTGIHIEIGVPPGEAGAEFSRKFLDELEKLVKNTASYRGKIISLEQVDRYSGGAGIIRVLKLRSVRREDVILPEKTLRLLERNVHDFIKQRAPLKKLGMQVKKGLLFYGPPGTGKTHTIHYLASQLPEHTTLLITAEQVAYIDHYFQLARFLQPAMIVIEDVDLIARSRDEMRGACEESLLNKLLNEMDGLREDAEILFVLTTNRPDQLEAALASRPGRVDQAIEFPLPDADCRRQLVRLYSYGVPVAEETVEQIVHKTKNASAAFIKELMRRATQFYLEEGRDGALTQENLTTALEEMLFSGGSLNVKLLGGALPN